MGWIKKYSKQNINSYNYNMFEDEYTNSFVDTLKLFDNVVNNCFC